MSQSVSHFETVDRHADSTLRRVADPEAFVNFLDSLSPDQMSLLIRSGALDENFAGQGEDEPDFGPSYPSKTEPEGFDFERWKNRPGPKIR